MTTKTYTCSLCDHDNLPENTPLDVDGEPVCETCREDNPYWMLGSDFDDEHGEPFGLYLANIGEKPTYIANIQTHYEAFIDAYRGTWDTVKAYAEDYIDGCYDLEKMMGNLSFYFDYDAFARDLELGGDIWSERGESGQLHIFDNH